MKDVRVAGRYCRSSTGKKTSKMLRSLETRPVAVGSLETAVKSLGPHPQDQSNVLMELEALHHPVEQFHPLRRALDG